MFAHNNIVPHTMTRCVTGGDLPKSEALSAFDKLASQLRENAETGCYDFVGSRDLSGYGQITINGRRWSAHRLMYTLLHGRIPSKDECDDGRHMILHRCDNPPCCNPKHLYLGNAAENSRDMADRCRVRVGYWRSRDAEQAAVGFGTVYWKIGGEVRTLKEWAQHFNVHPTTLDRRLSVGWPRETLGLSARTGVRTLAGRQTYERFSGAVEGARRYG
ncbi:HNH endonuclease [Sinorhizobium meliloti]|nr:HNH endonuclease [Sinorhizobium meliloti]